MSEAEGPLLRMPAEWARHRRCWMAWPIAPAVWGERLDAACEIYAAVAEAIAEFEPVTMITRPDKVASASLMCGQGVAFLPMEHDDSWTRDTAPSFVLKPDGSLAGIDWHFNGWGGVHPNHAKDAELAGHILDHLDAEKILSDLILEGGAIHVDGDGTALVCRTSILDPKRNPGLDEAAIEREFADKLGVGKTIWLPNGLVDDETNGHIDNLACFVESGHVLVQTWEDGNDPNSEAVKANLDVLESAKDARGRNLQISTIAAPQAAYRDDGRRLTLSYINFYMANDAVIMPGFNDPADKAAFRTMQQLFPSRKIVQLQVRDLIHGGGGIHCITQQQPWSAADGD